MLSALRSIKRYIKLAEKSPKVGAGFDIERCFYTEDAYLYLEYRRVVNNLIRFGLNSFPSVPIYSFLGERP